MDAYYYPNKLKYAKTDIVGKEDCVAAYKHNRIMAKLAKNDKNFIWYLHESRIN